MKDFQASQYVKAARALEIVERYARGEKQAAIARAVGVCRKTVRDVVRGLTWPRIRRPSCEKGTAPAREDAGAAGVTSATQTEGDDR